MPPIKSAQAGACTLRRACARRSGVDIQGDSDNGGTDLGRRGALGGGTGRTGLVHRPRLEGAAGTVVRKVVPLNMGALFLSVIGLMMVILGIFMG